MPSALLIHTPKHSYSHQRAPDDFTDYAPLIKTWKILLEIDTFRPACSVPDCYKETRFGFI